MNWSPWPFVVSQPSQETYDQESEGKILATVTIQEAQPKLPDLIHKLTPGDEVVITENNLPVAKLVVEKPPIRQRPGPGLCKGMITIVADDDDHLKDFEEYRP